MELRRPIVGVMGGGSGVSAEGLANAHRLGELVAGNGWFLLTGGRAAGVMEEASRGAAEGGGLVIGVSPGSDDRGTSRYVHVPIRTGMGNARNVINVLSSDVVVACEGGPGTVSEAALALKCGRNLILLGLDDRGLFSAGPYAHLVHRVSDPEEAVRMVERVISPTRGG